MISQEFKYKLSSCLQDQLNFGVKLSNSISEFAKRCLSIYKQMQATNRIKDKAKSSRSAQILAFSSSNTRFQSVYITNTWINTLFRSY